MTPPLPGLAPLRARLDEAMAGRGAWPERSPWLREAVAALPRDLFAPDRLWRWDGHAYVPVDRHGDTDGWARELYGGQDAAAVTQVTAGFPSSSLSAQGVVVDMLDSLLLEAGHRVWDIGTGQGWNAALAAWRAGSGRVVSTEVDEGLAAFARGRLAAAGLRVKVAVADATVTVPDEPVDRLIATYAVERVPWAWVAAVRPGGRLVVPWGRLGHVALDVADDGRSATGWVQGLAQFMADRTTGPVPAAGHAGYAAVRGTEAAEAQRVVERGLAPLAVDWDLRFALRVAVPDAVVVTGADEDGVSAWVHDGDRSWAALSARGDGTATMYQGGPRRVGDELMIAWAQWEGLGRPSPYDYGMTVRPDGQFVWLSDPVDGPRWASAGVVAAGGSTH
ncbi:methyltransferase domain-containing protein [Streptomyces sp. CB01881]|uniref:methyltransferase domain-containing protein n=1 Tax=Streptomyces sp. CB01881 TaxID=2078691 RepID=UPI001F4FADDC|nr:methyltransferase domain-containing protein [Streptomyces sp. CB01881]